MALYVRKRYKRRLNLLCRAAVDLAPRAEYLDEFVPVKSGMGHLLVQ